MEDGNAVKSPPNILVVLFDQLRYDVVDDPALCAAPHLDRLRRHGTWFERHYTPAGICSPARASLMTGMYPHTHGVLNNVHSWAAVVRDLPAEHRTLGELLSDAGYRTGYVGKWHLGMTQGVRQRGFDEVRSPEVEDDPSLQAGLEGYLDSMVYTRPREGAQQFPLYLRDPVPPSLIPANRVLEGTLDILERCSGATQPFFLVASFAEPHHPTILPEPYVHRYDPSRMQPWPGFGDTFEGKSRAHRSCLEHFGVAAFTWDDWRPIVARYIATVTMLDDLVGRLMAELHGRGRADDTVVIVTADHGGMTGDHRQFNKGPLMYEDVYHVPFLVHTPWLAVPPGGRRVPGLTSHVDVLPTIAEIAGLSPAPRSGIGRSLLRWLHDEQPEWRSSLMCEYHGDEFGLYSQRMILRGPHKLVYNPNDVTELYDLSSDPFELHNLALDGPAAGGVRRELEQELLGLMRATRDGLAEFAGAMLG